ncbi:MAG: hypothetical protein KC994_20155, partial [Candidatus Omnitrophica bacterium]|nr:hypothetical protein [Candidatus Omnitrophota bacterium]
PTIEFAPTGKSIPGNQLLTELIQQGIYWSPGVTSGGDWVLGAVETHRFDDPNSWYLKELRENLLHYLGYLGYDRFEHFGYLYPWNRYPDYGAGGLLNVPPGNAPWDMRALHMNSLWMTTLANYVLATGDVDFLEAKRARWVATNGSEPQPICGGNLSRFDYVLASGDVRLDGQTSQVHHSLGQIFTANVPFTEVRAYLGNPSLMESSMGKMALYRYRGEDPIAETDFTITPNLSREVALPTGSQLPSGSYFLEVTDPTSGSRYFGPGLVWWTETDSDYEGGEATLGPIEGNVMEELKAMFSYVIDHMGVEQAGFPHYPNDPEYNIPNHKSGRHGVSTTTSFWEAAGGGFDFFEAIWFPAACQGMSELSQLIGDSTGAEQYRNLRSTAIEAMSEKFWREFNDGGFTGHRFHACEDWNGVPHDFGFTYYNLEAAVRGVASATQTREILWWLDRGPWSSNGGTTWNKDIYSIWEIAPPFNTRANSTWLNVTGTLPFMEVVTNGGARLDIAARDLQARARHLSIDNAHERNLRILSRYASPDRLTGGRTFDDPGGRGRWQFLGPNKDRLDFEGFREIFPSNGVLASVQPEIYLGFETTHQGLRLQPKIPSVLDSIHFSNIGYWQSLFDFTEEASRETILELEPGTEPKTIEDGVTVGQTFVPSSPFNKVGLQVFVSPFNSKLNNGLRLILEEEEGGDWIALGSNWYNHLEDSQWVWVTVDRTLKAGSNCRLRIVDTHPADGETLLLAFSQSDNFESGAAFQIPVDPSLATRDFALRVELERTELTIETVDNSHRIPFHLIQFRDGEPNAVAPENEADWKVLLEPGQEVFLSATIDPVQEPISIWRVR